jgi:ParB-like chromosome segregation protein Spo0J
MKIKNKRIADLTPYANNPRINDEAVEAVANSIKEFGFLVPIVIDKTDTIVAGHTRYKAAIALGLDSVPTVDAGNLTDKQIQAFRLADNKTAELAEWDFDKLTAELETLSDFDMSLFGFNESDFGSQESDESPKMGTYHEKFSVVVDCTDEEQQKTVYELLTENGYTPRIVSL